MSYSESIPVWNKNLVLSLIPPGEREYFTRHSQFITLRKGDVIFEPGDTLSAMIFPIAGTVVSLFVQLKDGRSIETATIGREGALGGILSQTYMPAFARGVVQIGGEAVRISTCAMEGGTDESWSIWNAMIRYSSCLLTQVLQSVACNAGHSIEQRCARWLLTLHDRLGNEVLPITHELLAEMLGVPRTYLTAILKRFQQRGLIETGRRKITIRDGAALQATACECHGRVRDHFSLVLGTPMPSDGALGQLDPDVAPSGREAIITGKR